MQSFYHIRKSITCFMILFVGYTYADFNPYIGLQNRSSHTIYLTSDYINYQQILPNQDYLFHQLSSGEGHNTIHTYAHIWDSPDSSHHLLCDIEYSFDDMSDGIYTTDNFSFSNPTGNLRDQKFTLSNIQSDNISILNKSNQITCSLSNISFGSAKSDADLVTRYAAVKPLIVISDVNN